MTTITLESQIAALNKNIEKCRIKLSDSRISVAKRVYLLNAIGTTEQIQNILFDELYLTMVSSIPYNRANYSDYINQMNKKQSQFNKFYKQMRKCFVRVDISDEQMPEITTTTADIIATTPQSYDLHSIPQKWDRHSLARVYRQNLRKANSPPLKSPKPRTDPARESDMAFSYTSSNQ